MRLDIKENTTSNNYELIFSELPPSDLRKVLRELDFDKANFGGYIYTVNKIPAYQLFIESLQKNINSGKSWEEVSNYPIFEPTRDSINKKLFSIVTILYKENDVVKEQEYIIFELYKKTISTLINDFGRHKHGTKFHDAQVSKKKLKLKARHLLSSNLIIDRAEVDISNTNSSDKTKVTESDEAEAEPIKSIEVTQVNEVETESIKKTEVTPTNEVETEPKISSQVAQSNNDENESSFIKNQLAIIISVMIKDELGVYDILSTIIDEMVKDLKEAKQLSSDKLTKESLIKSINKYKASFKDLQPFERGYVRGIMGDLLLLLDDTNEELEIEKGALSLKRSIWVNDSHIENVLVPIHAREPFVSGDVKEDHTDEIKMFFNDLYEITEDTLHEASTLELFYLAQLEIPFKHGILVTDNAINDEWAKRGADGFAELGFPFDLEYPYVNIHAGYFNIAPLRAFIKNPNSYQWSHALLRARPLVDLYKAMKHIDLTIEKMESALKEYADITLKKADQDSEISSAVHRLNYDVESLKSSRHTIYKYLYNKNKASSVPKDVEKNSKSDSTANTELKYNILNTEAVANLETLRLAIADQKMRSQKSFLENEIEDTIKELENDERRFDSPYGSIINSIIEELKKIRLFSTDEARKIGIKKISNNYKSWLRDSQPNERDYLLGFLNYFLLLLNDTTIALEKEKGTLSIKRIIWTHNLVIQNVLVPIHATEPFASGAINSDTVEFQIKVFLKHLYKIEQNNLHEASSLDLFYLAQLEDPQTFDISIESEAIEKEWEKRGAKGFEQLGFPTDLKYPYMSLELGYIDIQPLEHFLLNSKAKNNSHSWWYAIRHARPIADIEQMLVNIDAFLNYTSNRKEECLEDDKEASEKNNTDMDCYRLLLTIKNIEESKQVILDYLDSIEDHNTKEVELEASETTIKRELHHELQEVISEFISIEDDLIGEQETIIATTIHDLEAVSEISDETKFINELHKSIESFKDWVSDLEPELRDQSAILINRLITHVGGRYIVLLSENSSLVIAKDIKQHDGIVENVLVPIHAKEPFQSGKVSADHIEDLKKNFPNLYAIKTNELHDVSALELFQLSQLPHPTHYGMQVFRNDLLKEWENRGVYGFEEIGFPTDMRYPYVNIHAGYRSVTTLASALENSFEPERSRYKWWAVVEHARPIADLSKGISIIDKLLTEKITERQAYINPKTNRPKTKKEHKEAYHSLSFDINQLERSKKTIVNYMESLIETKQENSNDSNTKDTTTKEDYIDRVIATMHLAYRDAIRLSKKKIENLLEQTGAPSLGELWEAVELSWLLWYKMIYNEPLSFEARLSKMVDFWNKVQPTYAYSDSSKELYKQYSTPCPIGAIIAQYTRMDHADSIFEPSAGNGLLLVGANPKITRVNEIDKSRKKSLEFQQFQKITMNNGAQAFPNEMEKAFDVVVTNPPFAKWEEDKIDKENIIRKYFNNTRGLAQHLRLEHIMSGLALRTMKDNGKCAIIIMGHLYFDEQGFIAKYRPFFNWLYHFYKVDVVLNMNSFKLYNKQGAVAKTMLILIGGRKADGNGVAPTEYTAPHLDTVIDTFEDLWSEVKQYIKPDIHTIIKQLQIAKRE
ncbi:N-6 DNA methylase [Kordia sp.]|uniref:N-6 DNA methylase n=1 Tax=Kordia sp. TaxID=1965332 RepID=UPI003D293BCB